MAEESVGRGFADGVLDEVLPEDFDWEEMVSKYPSPSLAVASVIGFVVGYRHGSEIVEALGAFLGARVESAVENLLDPS